MALPSHMSYTYMTSTLDWRGGKQHNNGANSVGRKIPLLWTSLEHCPHATPLMFVSNFLYFDLNFDPSYSAY